jgi:hypothetical protein
MIPGAVAGSRVSPPPTTAHSGSSDLKLESLRSLLTLRWRVRGGGKWLNRPQVTDSAEPVWLRGVDLNHRPLGYEFNISFGLVLPVREFQQLSDVWFSLFRLVLDSHGSNLVAIPTRVSDAKLPVITNAFGHQHAVEVGR